MKKGSHHKPESINKMSESHKGHEVTLEQRRKQSEASMGEKNHFYNKHHTKKSKREISESKKGTKASVETKIRMSKSHKGHEVSLQTRQKISNGNKGEKHYNFGKHLPEDQKRKISESTKGEKSHMFGTHLSDITKGKISKTHKGIPLSENHKRKLSEGSMGEKNHFYKKKHKSKSKLKMAEYRRGKKMPLEIKLKISESLKGEKSHLWKGGISFEPYGLEFNKELREQIRARDNYCCQECNKYESELFSKNGKPERLSVHHINYIKTDCRPTNLISLCKKCHCKTNFNREYWTAHFQKKILTLGGDKNGKTRLEL